jgi:hypothetical protein
MSNEKIMHFFPALKEFIYFIEPFQEELNQKHDD